MTIRFMYDNLITAASMITASSLKTGIVTTALKDGTGSATMQATGAFSGEKDLEYTIEIDSITGGQEVTEATMKWSDGEGSWNATGQATTTSYAALNNDVEVRFANGSGDDFELEDTWYLKAINIYNAERLLDWDRDSRYRSASLESPNTLTIDLGSAKEIKAMILFDHNFTSAATLTIKGHTADSWATPDFSESFTWNEDKILHYLSTATTKRYWRIEITDAANTDNYLEIGELFLGSFFEPNEMFNFSSGQRDVATLLQNNATAYGVVKKRFFNHQRKFKYDLKYITDIDDYLTMLETIVDKVEGTITPIYFNEDTDELSDFWMVEFEKLPWRLSTNTLQTSQLILKEIVSSV